jgi:hypothetical protein
MDLLRKVYRPAQTTDPDDASRPKIEELDGDGVSDPEPGDLNMTQQDIMTAISQLKGDENLPASTREIIDKISRTLKTRKDDGPDHPDDYEYAASSPTGSDSPSPSASEAGGPQISNPKTVEAIKQMSQILQGLASGRGGPVVGDDYGPGYSSGRGLGPYPSASGGRSQVHYAPAPTIDLSAVGQATDLDTSANAGTPTNYKGAKNPQDQKYHPSRAFLIGVSFVNFVTGILYVQWRFTKSMRGLETSWFSWLFLIGETLIVISSWQSHCSRFFPVKRSICNMDDLAKVDSSIGARTPVTIFLPNSGETLEVIRTALFGIMSMRLWPSDLRPTEQLRVLVLDEKRRQEVIVLTALVYKFTALFANNPNIKVQLKRDRVTDITSRGFYGFYEQCTARFGRPSWHACYTEAFEVAKMIEKICKQNKIPDEYDGVELPSGRRVEPTQTADNGRLPRLREDFTDVPNIPSIVYISRRNPGEPFISPKAGNMNSVLFPEDPVDEDVVNKARFVVINDARHAFEPEYLQRVVPYFFELKRVDGKYRYDIAPRVAFIQVPQRFKDRGDGDPFGNRSAVMFDVTNIGRDGVGGVMSCGQGSIWRVDVIRDGITAEGKKSVDPVEIRSVVGTKVGYSQLSRIEDTMTSIGLFAKGFKSVYVNEENEILGSCTQEPNSMDWRIKQLFRWHYGAVELFSMGPIKLQEGRFPSIWHRIYVWESCTYFFQAISAQIFLLMPIWYCLTWQPPFTTYKMEFVLYLIPYFLTAVLPTTIGLGWRKVNPDLVSER